YGNGLGSVFQRIRKILEIATSLPLLAMTNPRSSLLVNAKQSPNKYAICWRLPRRWHSSQ
ncbi:MAG: hypothetical protein WBO18_03575, partial [Gammaproteobacteria bacterium]